MLDPIYHIARGMQPGLPSWDAVRLDSIDAFSSKVQGSIDRDKIIASIDYQGYNGIVKEKITWLKEWIRESSDAEVQAFLKFAIGSASLPNAKRITVDAQFPQTPYLGASTCDMKIHMSDQKRYPNWGAEKWDNTKEAFIRNLKNAMSVEGFQKR